MNVDRQSVFGYFALYQIDVIDHRMSLLIAWNLE